MLEALYELLIYPIYLLIKYLFFYVTPAYDPIITTILVSIIVNVICLPFYIRSDNVYEHNLQVKQKFEKKLKAIKHNFKGDEKLFMINELYKQYNYSPYKNLQNLLVILIQIPFFIAAYQFFSNLSDCNYGIYFISNLMSPDKLLKIKNITINILPIIMTLINICSGEIYLKTLNSNKRLSIYLTAIIFLVLLYNSPSLLVIYWTCNNIFSLFKNIVILISRKYKNKKIQKNDNCTYNTKIYTIIFLLSCLCITLYTSLTIPLSSSINKIEYNELFSYADYIKHSIYITAGIFLIYPMIIYSLLRNKAKIIMSYIIFFILLLFLANYIIINNIEENEFLINWNFVPIYLHYTQKAHIISGIIILIDLVVVSVLYKYNLNRITISTNIAIFLSLIYMLYNNFIEPPIIIYPTEIEIGGYSISKQQDKLHLTKNGENIFVFFIDTASIYYMNKLIEHKPEIKEILDGFVYYNNTLSFIYESNQSLPSLMGGYEYAPIKFNEDNFRNTALESVFLLPVILSKNNYGINYIDSLSYGYTKINRIEKFENKINEDRYNKNVSVIFNSFKEQKINDIIPKENIIEKLIKEKNIKNIYYRSPRNSILYAVIICSPSFIRNYFVSLMEQPISAENLKDYAWLYYLTDLIATDGNRNTYNFISNYIVHNDLRFESFEKLFIELEKFIILLKKNNLYNNSKIIIVGDHGTRGDYTANDWVDYYYPFFNDALLLYKDFNSIGDMKIDNNYMTVADVPYLILNNIVDNDQNPFTQNKIKKLSEKEKRKFPIYTQDMGTLYNLNVKQNNINEIKKCEDCLDYKTIKNSASSGCIMK